MITTDDTWEDLVLGRRLSAIEEAIDDPDWLRRRPQDTTRALSECGFETLRGRIRADAAYAMLEGLLRLFGQVREDRTSLLFVSSGLSQQGPDRRGLPDKSGLPPKMGLVNGRIQVLRGATDLNESFCRGEGQRLVDTDFSRRFDELTRIARASNVAFYTVPVLVPDFAGMMPIGALRRPVGRPDSAVPERIARTAGQRHGRRRGPDCGRRAPRAAAHHRRHRLTLSARLLHDQHEVGRQAARDQGALEIQRRRNPRAAAVSRADP